MVNNRPRNSREEPEKSSGSCCLLISIMLVLGLSVAIATLPVFNFKRPLKAGYYKMPPIPPLEGNLKQNDKLSKATYIGHQKLRGPETIVFSANGSMYTGLMNGQIVRVDSEGKVHKVVQMGTETNEALCNDFSKGLHAECGRPLGLRIKPNTNTMYVADAYNGLFKVDLNTGSKTLLLGAKDPRFGTAQPKVFNDLDLDGDVIYFIDSSYERPVSEAIEDVTEMLARGRLFSYNEKTDKLEFLLENLYFPNGLQLLPSKDAVLINECSIARIIKFYLSGPKKGQKEVWADLPGYGDTLRLTERNTIMAPIAGPRHGKFMSIQDMLGEYPVIRTIIGTVFNLNVLYLKFPKYGILVEYDLNGKLLKSWHDPTGQKIECITNAELRGNKIYLGSFYNDFIGVVDYE